MSQASGWVIARPVDDGHIVRWQYWCGNQGGDKRSLYRCDAYHFASASEALLCADTHDELRLSDEWRVINAATANTVNHGLKLLQRAIKGAPPRECD